MGIRCRRRIQGLTPVEWVLALSLVLILVSTAGARVLVAETTRNQAAARHALNTFYLAQNQVQQLGGAYATPRELCGVDAYRGQVRGPDMLGDPWPELTSGDHAGVVFPFAYRLAFYMDDERRYWVAVAWPQTWGEDGYHAFAITQQGTVMQTSESEQAQHWATGQDLVKSAWGSLEQALSSANVNPASGWELR